MDKEQLSQLEKDDKTCPNSPIKEGNIMIKSSSLRGSFLFWGKGKTLPAPPRLANTFHDHPPTSRVRECDRWYASGLGSVQNHPVVADLVGLLAQNLSTCWDRNWLTRKWLQLGLRLILSANHLWYTLQSQHPNIIHHSSPWWTKMLEICQRIGARTSANQSFTSKLWGGIFLDTAAIRQAWHLKTTCLLGFWSFYIFSEWNQNWRVVAQPKN